MSHKRKSRSIVTFPVFNRHENSRTNTFKHDLDENITCSVAPPKLAFKNINRESEDTVTHHELNSPTNSYSTTGSDLEGILDLSNKLSGLSSSSSLSWSEDYELEITKKVQLELEKLDRAFQGVEEVPIPHDKDEIAEWKHFFPHLCILDQKTPTNSTENSEVSSESENETPSRTDLKQRNISKVRIGNFSRNKSSLANKKRIEEQAQNFLNANRNYHPLPHKPRSLEIEKYLKISSIKSPDTIKRKQNSQHIFTRQPSKERLVDGDASPEYTSLPFITATPVKTQIRKPLKKTPKVITLPPITNNFRSVSATPRQASSKSMFVSLNFEKDSSARGDQIRLRNDLMKLFELIPISNR